MITYIIPSYNQGEFIKYTVDSVLINMSDKDQLIIQDGNSSDSTYEVIKPYLSDIRIEWYSEPDLGFSDALAKAFRKVKNNIVGIQSSDDAYKTGIREKVIKAFEKEVIMVYADYEKINIENQPQGKVEHKQGCLEDFITLRVLLPQSSLFFDFNALKNIKILDLKYDYVADIVLFNQIAMVGKVLHIPEIWSEVRVHSGSRTGKRNPGTQYIQALDDVFFEIKDPLKKKAMAGAIIAEGRYFASSGNKYSSIRNFILAFNLDKSVVFHWIFLKTIKYLIFGPKIIDNVKRVIKYK
jgi:glycosyltransferase involved in cell wall biosynthesis